MTKEEKNLLLKDLCARLLYGVKILHQGWNYEWDQELSTLEKITGIDDKFIYTKVIDTHNGEEYRDDERPIDTFNDKLYLFPLSSMTEEQKKEYNSLRDFVPTYHYEFGDIVEDTELHDNWESIDYLIANHFDYRGLIPKGLANDATGLNIY